MTRRRDLISITSSSLLIHAASISCLRLLPLLFSAEEEEAAAAAAEEDEDEEEARKPTHRRVFMYSRMYFVSVFCISYFRISLRIRICFVFIHYLLLFSPFFEILFFKCG